MVGISIVKDGAGGYAVSQPDIVEAKQNSVGHATPIVTIDPERGTFLRFMNRVSKGEQIGLPLYMKLRDTNGALIPVNSQVDWRIEQVTDDQPIVISEEADNISYWNTNSITTQRDTENVDAVKIPFKTPSVLAGPETSDAPKNINVPGTAKLHLYLKSQAQVDWAESEFFVESEAVSKHSSR
ncbi:hypothetical protein [Haladaptatus sp. DYF46]|uniref:hypothetical protein n=1 Tax=Haladaptatus sp. DYF46 TaxID=2886041 RepID=UPI001E33D503|nr:hypothetical protein [Haladaptatus sp. DYF46]